MRADISDWSVWTVYGLEFWILNFSKSRDWYIERVGDKVYLKR